MNAATHIITSVPHRIVRVGGPSSTLASASDTWVEIQVATFRDDGPPIAKSVRLSVTELVAICHFAGVTVTTRRE